MGLVMRKFIYLTVMAKTVKESTSQKVQNDVFNHYSTLAKYLVICDIK